MNQNSHEKRQTKINHTDKNSHHQRGENDHHGRSQQFFPGRPGHLFKLLPRFLKKLVQSHNRFTQARRESNPQPQDLESRALTNWSYWPSFDLPMRRLFPAKPAEFFELQSIRMRFFILARRIIATFTFGARKGNNLLHKNSVRFEGWTTFYFAGFRPAKALTPRFG